MWKYSFFLLFVLALTYVSTDDTDAHAGVKSAYNQNDGFGHFKYGHDISNGVDIKAEGDVNSIHGEYYFLNENGEKVKVTYTADSTGFHPKIEGA